MQDKSDRNRITINIWTARLIPLVLAGVVGYATYVLVALLCVNYLLVKHNDKAAAIPILVIYFLLFIFMTASFARLLHITIWHPPYVPLGTVSNRNTLEKEKNRQDERASAEAISFQDPDSPGLEKFYTKDVFICEMDGKPKWCSQCSNWKPDRAHHCSSSGRCVLKMDHFCPWVGGAVGENNFKFFIQFTGYTALFCTHLLVVMAFYVHRQVKDKEDSPNRHFGAILGLATFFGLFTAGMTATSLHLAIKNLTQVEKLGSTRISILAVLKPSRSQLESVKPHFPLLTYPEITYPLRINQRSLSQEEHGNGSYQTPSNDLPKSPSTTQNQLSNGSTATNLTGENYNSPPSHLQSVDVDRLPDAEPIAAVQPLPLKPEINEKPHEVLSARDAKAFRTFAILQLPLGSNAWDLGNWKLNLQTVMGTNILDWVFPIRRSPCCNHEHQESRYSIGPVVDELKVSVSLMNPEDIRGGRSKHSHLRSNADVEIQDSSKSRKRKKRAKSKGSGAHDSPMPHNVSDVPSNPVRMDNLTSNGQGISYEEDSDLS